MKAAISPFRALIDQALDEIRLRDPCYLGRFPLTMPSLDTFAKRHVERTAGPRYSQAQLEQVFAATCEFLHSTGVLIESKAAVPDHLSDVILDSALDAFVAGEERNGLNPYVAGRFASLRDLLAAEYAERHTARGTRYFIRNQGDRSVVLISAVGIPLNVWSKFLLDPSLQYRMILVEGGSGDLIHGGLERHAELEEHALDIADVIERERLERIDVLAWCNGARVAFALADYCDKVHSLTLVSPALMGIEAIAPKYSLFEDGMLKIFATIAERPSLANLLAGSVRQQNRKPDWTEYVNDPVERSTLLLRLPAEKHAAELIAPLTRGDYLINFSRRVSADSAYPIHESIARAQIPILLVTGSHDAIVENSFACTALHRWAKGVVHADVEGAGHYINDLQYVYFRAILRQFFDFERIPSSCARVKVGPLAQARERDSGVS